MPRGLTPRARPTRAWDAAGAHAPGEAHRAGMRGAHAPGEAHPGAADGRGGEPRRPAGRGRSGGIGTANGTGARTAGASPSVPSLALLLYPHQPRSRERARDPPFFGDYRSPPGAFWGADSRGGVGSLDQHRPGMGQAERSDPEAPVPRPWTGRRDHEPGRARGTGAAGAGPRRAAQGQPRWLAGRWTDRKRRSDHELVSSGVEQDAILRPSRQYWR